jgi:hypothetical protein
VPSRSHRRKYTYELVADVAATREVTPSWSKFTPYGRVGVSHLSGIQGGAPRPEHCVRTQSGHCSPPKPNSSHTPLMRTTTHTHHIDATMVKVKVTTGEVPVRCWRGATKLCMATLRVATVVKDAAQTRQPTHFFGNDHGAPQPHDARIVRMDHRRRRVTVRYF